LEWASGIEGKEGIAEAESQNTFLWPLTIIVGRKTKVEQVCQISRVLAKNMLFLHDLHPRLNLKNKKYLRCGKNPK
jgi:hypothetical protein